MDLKEQYQLRAEEIAETKHNMDFYDLSDDLQSKVYGQAEVEVMERLMSEAENLQVDQN
ncbi:hypothetical protein ES707_22138 [subsurface metagenome]